MPTYVELYNSFLSWIKLKKPGSIYLSVTLEAFLITNNVEDPGQTALNLQTFTFHCLGLCPDFPSRDTGKQPNVLARLIYSTYF